MRKLTKKISMLMVLAMLVGLFSGVVSASAASKWSFKSNDGDYTVAPGETINLDQNQYEKFILSKDGANAADYTITWESSDADVVFVNAKTGQLRANKAAADGAEAVITGNIVNVNTKKTHKVSFNIVVGEVKSEYTLQAPKFTESQEIGKEIKFSTNVLDKDGKNVSFKDCGLYRAYFIDGKAIANPWTPTEAKEYTITVGAFTAKADTADLAKAVDSADFKVVVRSDKAEIVAVEQVALNLIRVVFNDAFFASKVMPVVKDDIEDAFELTFNADEGVGKTENRVDLELYDAWISDVQNNVVYISTYKNLEENLTYKLSYLDPNNKENVLAFDYVTGSGTVPAKVEIIDDPGYVIGDYRPILYKVYNANDVIINAYQLDGRWVNLEGGFDETIYPIEWSRVSAENENYDFDTSNGSVYFIKKDVKATVEIKIDLGYDDNGNELADVKKVDTVHGIDDTNKLIVPDSYHIGTDDTEAKNYVGKDVEQKFFVGQGDEDSGYAELFLHAHYSITDEYGKKHDKYIFMGESTDSECTDTFTYQSSNTDIVSVNEEDGRVYPVAVGKAKIYIKCDGQVIGYATVRVYKQPELDKFTATIIESTDKVSVVNEALEVKHHGIADRVAKVQISYKNQIDKLFGLEDENGVRLIGVDLKLLSKIKNEANLSDTDPSNDLYTLDELFEYDEYAKNKWYFEPKDVFVNNGDDSILKPGKKMTIKVQFAATFECKDGTKIEKFATATFAIKNIEGVKALDPKLVFSTDKTDGKLDMNLAINTVDNDSVDNRLGSIQLIQNDPEGFFVRELPIAATFRNVDDFKTSATAKADGNYTLVITKGDVAIDGTAPENKIKVAPIVDGETVCDHGCTTPAVYTVTVDPITATTEGKIVKADIGNYKVRLYKGNGTTASLKTTKYMNIVDTTPEIKATKIKEWLEVGGYASMNTLTEVVTFTRGGANLDGNDGTKLNGIAVNADIDYKTDDTSRVYIYSIKFNLPVNVYNNKWAGTEYTEETVYIKKTFTEK